MGVITVDTLNRQPIYEQLVDNIRQNVLRGTLAPGEQLPSVRSLAGELAINPNTIQKAYTELERLGIIISLPGRGNFVSDNVEKIADENRAKLLDGIRGILVSAFDAGIERAKIDGLISQIWRTGK